MTRGPTPRRTAAASSRATRFAFASVVAVVVLVGAPYQYRNARHRLYLTRDYAATSAEAAEARLLGEENAAALQALRRLIPPDGEYLLAESPDGLAPLYVVRYALAPRRAVLSGHEGTRAIDFGPEPVPETRRFLVLAMREGRPVRVIPPRLDGGSVPTLADAVDPARLLPPAAATAPAAGGGAALGLLSRVGWSGLVLLAVAASGLWAARLVPLRSPWPAAGRLALSWLFGVATLGGAALLASHAAGLRLGPAACRLLVLAATLAGAIPALVSRLRRPSPPAPAPSPGSRPERWLFLGACAGLAVVAGFLLLQAVVEPISDWDGRMTWDLHARYMRAEGTASPRALTDPSVFTTHPQYPPLLPLVQAVVLEALACPPGEDRFVRPLYAAFFLAVAVLVVQAARRIAGRWGALVVALLLGSLPALSFFEDGGAAGTYSDYPLGAILGAALLLSLRASKGAGVAFGAGLLCAAAILTKNEGTPLALVPLALGSLAVVRRAFSGLARGTAAVRLLSLWAPAVLALVVLASWRAGIPNRYDEAYGELARSRLVPSVVLPQVAVAAPAVGRALLEQDLWSVLWIALPFLVVLRFRGLRSPVSAPFAAAAAAPLVLGLAAYGITTWGDVPELVRVTWHRFLLHGSIPWLLLLSLLALGRGRPFRIVPRPAARAGRESAAVAAVLAVAAASALGAVRLVKRAVPPADAAPSASVPKGSAGPASGAAPGDAGPPSEAPPQPAAPVEDGSLPASVDSPVPDAVVRGRLVVTGWARLSDEDLAVGVLLDGERREPAIHRRVGRPDVARVKSWITDASTAGYELVLEPRPGDEGEHDLQVVFSTKDGRVRHYPSRRFVWKP